MTTRREVLIEENIRRAQETQRRVGRESKTQQGVIDPTPQGKAPTQSPVTRSSRNRFGANLEVVQKLQLIKFESDANGDGAMRSAVARIRKWKRGGTGDIVPAQEINTNGTSGGFSIDPLQTWGVRLNTNLWEKYGDAYFNNLPNTGLGSGILSNSDSLRSYSILTTNPISLPITSGLFSTTPQVPTESQTPRVDFPATELRTSGSQVITQQIENGEGQKPSSFLQKAARVGLAGLTIYGTLRPANPWGTVGAWRFNRIPSTISNRTIYEDDGLDPKSRNSEIRNRVPGTWDTTLIGPSDPKGEESWQFLFNPSELELEAGPEFKNAETWGVGDSVNSGQPLHWSHNKNAILKFNSVLLNGYVFGRQVEDLEQGLFALFMSRDGQGQDGPAVLEFVWGQKVFGPCVIKNINVKEKQWDGGMVVNAEVSFTLEQVPEWTINDGFVDIARPGRLPIGGTAAGVASTSTMSTTTTANTSGPVESSTPNRNPTPVSSSSQSTSNQNLCKGLLADAKYAIQEERKLLRAVKEPDTLFLPLPRPNLDSPANVGGFDKYYKMYNNIRAHFLGSSKQANLYLNQAKATLDQVCLNPNKNNKVSNIKSKLSSTPNNNQSKEEARNLIGKLAACTGTFAIIANNMANSNKCKK